MKKTLFVENKNPLILRIYVIFSQIQTQILTFEAIQINMNNLKLKKVNQHENPFNISGTSTNTALHSLSKYNDRSKIVLTESESEEEEQFAIEKQQNQPKNILLNNRSREINEQQQTIKKVMKNNEINQRENGISNEDENRVTFGKERMSKERSEQQQEKSKRKVQNIQESIFIQQIEEEPADETDTITLLPERESFQPNFSRVKNQIPALVNASTVTAPQLIGGDHLKQSLIDKIKEQNFFQSQVIDESSKNMPRRRTKIFSKKPELQQQQIVHRRDPRREQEQLKNQRQRQRKRQQQRQYQHQHERERQRQRKSKTPRKPIYGQQKKQHYSNPRERRENEVVHCPHIQCVIKSLNIIDKLTDSDLRRHPQQQQQQQRSSIETKNEIIMLQNSMFEISSTISNLIINLQLQSLYTSDMTKNKIKLYKSQIERIVLLMRELEQKLTLKQTQIYQQCLWNITLEIQKDSRVITYLQIVQERYTMWRSKLNILMNSLKGLEKKEKKVKLERMKELVEVIGDMRKSKVYPSGQEEASFGFIEAYNDFIERESQLLQRTLQFAQQDILQF